MMGTRYQKQETRTYKDGVPFVGTNFMPCFMEIYQLVQKLLLLEADGPGHSYHDAITTYFLIKRGNGANNCM
jgi:hypothetical protein